MNLNNKTLALALAGALLALPLVMAAADGPSNAANKTSGAGSETVFLGPTITGAAVVTEATVLETTIKTSPPQDLIFSVTLECALWTTLATDGNDEAESTATVKIWVEVDGVPVPVGADDTVETGKVVFCDRTHRQVTTLVDDEDARIEQYLRTRSANAFNWLLPDVGGGVHLIQVKAELSGETMGEATSQAGIGHRTLIVEPTHMAQGATVDNVL